MNIVILDAGKLTTKEASHEYLKEVFAFPDHYGANLDALYDCLTDLDETIVMITNRNFAGAYFLEVYPVLREAVNTMTL